MYRPYFLAAWLGLSVASPACAAEAAPPLADYLKDWDTNWVLLSPSGERYALIAKAEGKQQLLVAKSDGKPGAAMDIGEVDVAGLTWAGDDHLILYTRTVGTLGPGFTAKKAWMTSALVLNLKTQAMTRVFDHQKAKVAGIVEGFYGESLIDGHWYGYFAGFNEQRQIRTVGPGSRRDLYQVDLDSGATKLVSEGSDQGDNWLVSPSGAIVARYNYQWSSGRWQVLAGPYGNKILASGQSRFGSGGGLRLGQSPDEIVFTRPADAEGRGTFQTLSLSGTEPVDIPDNDQIDSIVADGQTGLWIGTVRVGDKPEVQFFSSDLEQKARKAYRAFPNQMTTLKSWSSDFTKIITFTSGSSDSGTYYLVDLTKNKADPIGYAYPTIGPKAVGPVRMVEYRAADGLALHGVLSLPPGRQAKNLPLVVIPHDALVGRGHPDFHSTAQAFASRGYAVLEPDPRGSGGYGSDYLRAGFGQWGRKIQTDMSDGVADLARQGVVDPKRVCIVGARYGGYAALAGVTVQHGLYRCAVADAPVTDLRALLQYEDTAGGNTENASMRYWKAFMGATSNSDPRLDEISPVKLAAQADAPILLIFNKDDPSSPSAQSKKMEDALERAGKTVGLLITSGLSNDTETEANRLSIVEGAIAFVEKYNPPDVSVIAGAAAVNGKN